MFYSFLTPTDTGSFTALRWRCHYADRGAGRYGFRPDTAVADMLVSPGNRILPSRSVDMRSGSSVMVDAISGRREHHLRTGRGEQ